MPFAINHYCLGLYSFEESPLSLSAGTHLGPYEVLGAIGAGGMGEVYQARDTRLKRTVAIKVLPRELSGDAQRRARLEREARTLASRFW